ncbi:hypothetical protein D3C77_74080 [compost metagenome]
MALVETFVVTAKDGRQVKAKAVHMHFARPVAQRVGDQLQHARVAQVQGVACAGVVDVEALVLGHQAVVGGIVDASHGQGRAQLVALGGVVVDYIEDHLQAGIVQVRHHLLEFGDFAVGQIAWMGREKGNAVVAPVIVQTFLQQVLVVDEGMNRQQLNGRHPQLFDMTKQFVTHQAGEGAAVILGHCRVAHADAAHVGFVEDGAIPRHADALVAAPGIGRVDDLAFGDVGGAVTLIEAEVAIRVANGVAKQCFGPFQAAHQLLGVRVDQQFVGVEAVAMLRLVGAMDAVAVDLSGMSVGEVTVKNFVGVFGQFDAFQFHLAAGVEQAQFDLGGVGREQGEVDPQAVPGSPQWKRQAFADTRGFDEGGGFWLAHGAPWRREE